MTGKYYWGVFCIDRKTEWRLCNTCKLNMLLVRWTKTLSNKFGHKRYYYYCSSSSSSSYYYYDTTTTAATATTTTTTLIQQ